MPYTRPRTKDGFFKKYEYVYDEHYDCYTTQRTKFLNTEPRQEEEGYRQYASNCREICKTCPFLEKCTQNKDHIKFIHRHIWEHYVEEADDLRITEINKNVYRETERNDSTSLCRWKREAWHAMDNPSGTGKVVHASDTYFWFHELKENGKPDMEKTMSSLNKISIVENDEQKKTNPNSNEAFFIRFVDSLKPID